MSMSSAFAYTSKEYPDEIETKLAVYKNTVAKRSKESVERMTEEIRKTTGEYRLQVLGAV